jgi:hypothetical protein
MESLVCDSKCFYSAFCKLGTSLHRSPIHSPHCATMRAVLSTFLFAAVASAHTILDEMYNGSTSYGLHNCLRLPSYDGPIMDVTSASMTCNGSPNTLDTVSTNVCSIAAGATITLRWGHTLTSGSNDVIDSSHKGPIMVIYSNAS